LTEKHPEKLEEFNARTMQRTKKPEKRQAEEATAHDKAKRLGLDAFAFFTAGSDCPQQIPAFWVGTRSNVLLQISILLAQKKLALRLIEDSSFIALCQALFNLGKSAGANESFVLPSRRTLIDVVIEGKGGFG
jgi:hypothetical protein